MKLEERLEGRSNNLSFLKFVAALVVILSHSYLLSKGVGTRDPFAQLTKGAMGMGSLGVSVFFFSSGIFITRSVGKNCPVKYFKSRVQKIFPPLLVVVIASMFIMGPLLTKLSTIEYFTSTGTYQYLANAFLIPTHNLPGVFDNNIYSAVVNGSLWTLPVEFFCYIMIFVLYKCSILKKKFYKWTAPFSVLFILLAYYGNISIFKMIVPYLYPIFIFYVGSLYYIYRNKITLNVQNACAAVFMTLILSILKLPEIGIIFFFTYVILCVSFSKFQCSKHLANLGKYSYGMYLVAFPVQQVIVHLWGGEMPVLLNFLISSILSLLLGIAMYYSIEKKIQFRKGF